MEAKPSSASVTRLTQVMQPGDANIAGFVHGGSIMKLVDTAAGIAAIRHCGGRAVTAQVDSLSFLAPVHIGDIIQLVASVNQSWRTSMEVGVRVERENPLTGERTHTTSAYLTFVAVDAGGTPVPVPPVRAETEEERRRQREANVRREGRIRLRDQIAAERGSSPPPPGKGLGSPPPPGRGLAGSPPPPGRGLGGG
ncbi:MAG: acyl-CoA thioesterase [Acidimicrobiia bacterium]